VKKKILFRADGNSQTGLGHLYRLFALVEMYKDTYDFIFVTKDSSTLKVIPQSYSIELIPNEINIKEEPKWLSNRFKPNEYIIIADGYQFVSSYQKSLKILNYFLMYIDDLTTEHMYADVVVNHSPNAKKTDYKSENYTQFALGTDYAILRPLFLDAAQKKKERTSLNSIFICYGGADEKNFTLQTSNVLSKIDKIDEINIVLGGAYTHSKTLLEHKKVTIYQNLNEKELISLMNRSDIAYVSSSTILYETITTNIVTFSGFFVQNQEFFYHELVKKEVFFGLDNLNNFDFTALVKKYYQITKKVIKNQLENQNQLIDGSSKRRFINLIKTI
jgi:UDP-2,4-diacetamido-2,4,6-trideoxy-beta-L-altropyranose hydrolase